MVKHILIIDNDNNEHLLFEKMLQETNLDLTIDYMIEFNEESEIIEQKVYDCIFLDYKIQGYLLTLDHLKRINPNTPIATLISQKEAQDGGMLKHKGDTFFLTKEYLSSVVFETSILNVIKVKQIQSAGTEVKELLHETQKITQNGSWSYNYHTKTFSLSDEALNILKCYGGMSFYSFCRKIVPSDFTLFKNSIRTLNDKYSTDLTVGYCTWIASAQFLNIRIISTSDGASGTIQDITRFKSVLLSNEMISLKSKATKISLIACASMLLIIEAVCLSYVDSVSISLLVAAMAITIMALLIKPLARLFQKILIKRIYCHYKEKVVGIIVGIKALRRSTFHMLFH